jgi:hypothetical protein
MARIAIERLELRRQNPGLAAVRITVPARLAVAETEGRQP